MNASAATNLSSAECAEIFRALGNPVRVEILRWLRDPETHFAGPATAGGNAIGEASPRGVCATDIQTKCGLAQSTTSANMSMLERAGLVRSTRVGKFIHYQRDEQRIADFLNALGESL